MSKISIPAEDAAVMEKMAKDLRKYKDSPIKFRNELYASLIYMYNLGIRSVIGGEVVETGRCVHIEEGSQWEMTCPFCGETYDIDMEAMLPKNDDGMCVNK